MKNYAYSPADNMFYSYAWKDDFDNAGTWPSDANDVSDDVYRQFSGNPPAGKMRVAGDNGMPAWGDTPPLTPEQRIAQAEQERDLRLDYANKVTADWRTELTLGVISDSDKTALIEWMAYIKRVKSTDVSNPENITWPVKPSA